MKLTDTSDLQADMKRDLRIAMELIQNDVEDLLTEAGNKGWTIAHLETLLLNL